MGSYMITLVLSFTSLNTRLVIFPKPEPASNIVSPGKIRSRIAFRRKSLSLPNDIALLTLSYCGIITRNTSMTSFRSEEHTSELQSRQYLVCRLLLEKKKTEEHTY